MSQIFRSGSSLLSDSKTTGTTAQKIQIIFDVLRANPKVSMQRLESLLVEIPKHELILTIHDSCGYNLLQKSVGLNHVELVKWVLHRHRPDVNRSPCSLPLHIACLRG